MLIEQGKSNNIELQFFYGPGEGGRAQTPGFRLPESILREEGWRLLLCEVTPSLSRQEGKVQAKTRS